MDEEMEKRITCCFTGHRPQHLAWGWNENAEDCRKLKRKIYDVAEALYDAGIRRFLCGMAIGCDTYFCEEILRLRERYTDVTIEAVLPCEDQDSRWTRETRKRYHALLEACDRVIILQREYTPGCMQRRNVYMVEKSSVLIAVYQGTAGGTQNTVRYAQKHGLEAIMLYP